MSTLSEVENAILRLSRVECDRLADRLETIRRNRTGGSEAAAKYRAEPRVVCGREKAEERFFTDPKLIVEVLSPATASVDRHEKRIAYRGIAALEEYVIVAQDAIEVVVFRREDSWRPAALESAESVLELRSIGLRVPLPR